MAAGLIKMAPMQWTNGAQLATDNLRLAGQMAASMDKQIKQTSTTTKSGGSGGIGGALGSAVGGIAGGFFGPGGAMLGSTLGGAIGGAIDGGGAGAASGALTGLGSSLKGTGGYEKAASGLSDLFSNSGIETVTKAASSGSDSGLFDFAKNLNTGDAMKLKYDNMGMAALMGLGGK